MQSTSLSNHLLPATVKKSKGEATWELVCSTDEVGVPLCLWPPFWRQVVGGTWFSVRCVHIFLVYLGFDTSTQRGYAHGSNPQSHTFFGTVCSSGLGIRGSIANQWEKSAMRKPSHKIALRGIVCDYRDNRPQFI